MDHNTMNPDVNDLLRQRYGTDDAPVLTDPAILGNAAYAGLLAHRSVRAFADAPVGDEVVTAIVAAAQSASTSSNTQVWSVVEVRDPDARRRLAEDARGSAFIPDAPVILLFVADWARAAAMSAREGAPADAADFLESTLVGFVDAGIAAQNAVVAAEALGLGACYLGSLRNVPEITAELAGLPERSVIAFGVALGWPDPDDTAGIKPRLRQSAVHSRETYRTADADDVAAYERALAEYNRGQQRPAASWAAAVVTRVRDLAGLHGREGMRDALRRRGLPSA